MAAIGACSTCGGSFEYELVHCGFADFGYAYCERCGQTALLDGWFPKIPTGAHLRIQQVIEPTTEPYLKPCPCGGVFRSSASPRCPSCHVPISAEQATAWIEANAPGTKVGWRWQQNWTGTYAIVIEWQRVCDNWLTSSKHRPPPTVSMLHNLAALHHERNLADRCDVFEGVAFHRDQIGLKPRRDGADLVA
jgi:hypothetical protein